MSDSVREKAEKIARQWLDVDNERWEHLHEDMVRIIAEGLDAYAAQQTAALRHELDVCRTICLEHMGALKDQAEINSRLAERNVELISGRNEQTAALRALVNDPEHLKMHVFCDCFRALLDLLAAPETP